MPRDLKLSCHCGKVQGQVAGVTPRRAMRAVCHCHDCRAFLQHIDAQGCVDADGGAELVLTLPGCVSFDAGIDQLRVLRLSQKGPLRWYTACCGTPMGNMVPRHVVRFISLPLAAFPDPVDRTVLGPLRGSLNAAAAPAGANPPADYGLRRFQFSVIKGHFASVIGLAPGGSPYLTADRKPIANVERLSDEERAAAYA